MARRIPYRGKGRKHAHLAPSSAYRWMLCPGSVALCKTVPPAKENEFAAYGTVFHRVMMLCLRHGFSPTIFEGSTLEQGEFSFEISEEFVDHAIEALDIAEELPGELYVEKRVSLERWIPKSIDPDTGGTLDVGSVGRNWITLVDWKYGSGVPVSPFRNPQVMSYGLGFWDEVARHITDADNFRFIVHQPRIPGGGGTWECSLDELLQFGKKLARAAERTTERNAPLVPGDEQCSYCPARGRCPAYDKFSTDLMKVKFTDLDAGPDPLPLLPASEMTKERRAYIVRHSAFIEQWLKDIHERVFDDAMSGVKGVGYKIIDGRRPHSKWRNKEEVEKYLLNAVSREEAYTRKLISPAQAKKRRWGNEIMGILEEQIDYGEPKPVLVPDDDPRESIMTIADKFDDLTR